MFLPLLLYYRLLNSPHGAILREGYSFSESVSAPESVLEAFPSSFLIFMVFTCPVWRWNPNGIIFDGTVPAGGFPRMGDNRGAELKYLGDRAGR